MNGYISFNRFQPVASSYSALKCQTRFHHIFSLTHTYTGTTKYERTQQNISHIDNTHNVDVDSSDIFRIVCSSALLLPQLLKMNWKSRQSFKKLEKNYSKQLKIAETRVNWPISTSPATYAERLSEWNIYEKGKRQPTTIYYVPLQPRCTHFNG